MKNKAYALYELPRIYNLKELVWKKAKEMPDKVAFTYSKAKGKMEKKTYQKFYDEINGLGTWLFMQELRSSHIAILGENSYEWLLAYFAIVNGGNVAVPVDKELPKEEIRQLLYKADVSVVFCSEIYSDLAEGIEGITVFYMSDISQYVYEGNTALAEGWTEYRDYAIQEKKPCCIFFTSGTLGTSKGVVLNHQNMAEDINGSCSLFEMEGNTIAVLPFHHAFGLVVSVMMAFHYGHTIYINKSLKMIRNDLAAANPQTMFLVPLFIETFYKQIWDNAKQQGKEKLLKCMIKISDCLRVFGVDIRKKCFANVRQAFGGELEYIISGGAGIRTEYIKQFRSFGIEILNGYGTTECSPCTAVNRNYHHKDGTVGLPLPGTKVKIAEDGEVLISGRHVMMEYYKDESATKEIMYEGWYKTGDLGHLDKDGFLTLTGRKKNLIILSNGENISPEELEREILKDSAVNEVLVYEKEGMITAEIFPREECIEDEMYFSQLIKKINQGKPLYKRIGKFVLRSTEFEKNSSKKIIRYKKMK